MATRCGGRYPAGVTAPPLGEDNCSPNPGSLVVAGRPGNCGVGGADEPSLGEADDRFRPPAADISNCDDYITFYLVKRNSRADLEFVLPLCGGVFIYYPRNEGGRGSIYYSRNEGGRGNIYYPRYEGYENKR